MPVLPSSGSFFSQSPGPSSHIQSDESEKQPEPARKILSRKEGRTSVQGKTIQRRTKKGRTILNQKTKQKHKKIRRGIKSKNKNIKIFSANADGLGAKANSLKSHIKSLNVSIFTLQETQLKSKGKFALENFDIFESFRDKEGGGSMIGVHSSLKSTLIEEYNGDFELIVVEVDLGKKVKIITGYGPQENRKEIERRAFFVALENEIANAELCGVSVFIELDANSKLGTKYIPNDPHNQSPNGKILSQIIERHHLKVANGLEICKGVITRRKVREDRTEESVIDLVLLSDDLVEDIKSITVDEERENVLTKIKKVKGEVTVIESDHNPIICELNFKNGKRISTERLEMFNLKNTECQSKFHEITTNTRILSNAFRKDENLNVSGNRFMKRLHCIIHSCFKKVRIGAIKENPKIN